MSDVLSEELGIVESLSKFLAIALGVLYLLGFLVVAAHLSRYGVSSFSVLQLQYLIAGIWLLGPLVLYDSVMRAQRRFDKRAVPETKGFNWKRFAIGSTLGSVPVVLLFVIFGSIPQVMENLTWGIIIRLYLFYLGIAVASQLFWLSWRGKEDSWLINRSHAAPFFLASLAMIVGVYAIWFSARIYPLIPSSLGGGRPLTIMFIEADKKFPEEIKKPDSSAKRSNPYRLLLSTDKYYVVVAPNPNERSLEISRESVAGIVVLE